MNDDSREQSETAGLVTAAQAGDKIAFGRLVPLYQRQAMGVALGTYWPTCTMLPRSSRRPSLRPTWALAV
jgi:hypothetical protein